MSELASFYGQVLHSVPRCHGFEPVAVEGALPPSLRGTFWRNGPGQFELFERPYVHWFDGDGLATAVRIADGRAQMACRIIECPQLARERAAGEALFASGQTRAPWWRMVGGRGKAVRNINILAHDGEIFGLAEGGLPIPLDPEQLTSGRPRRFAEGQPSFHGHYRVDPRDGTVYGFGIEYGRRCYLNVYRLPRGGAAERIAHLRLPGTRVLVHDVAFAGDAIIAIVHPMNIKVWPLMAGLKSPFEALDWRPGEGSEVFVIPLADPAAARRFTVPAFYNFHFGNAFRDGDAYQVDLARLPQLDFAQVFTVDAMRSGAIDVPDPSRFGRLTLKGDAAEWTALGSVESDFPAFDPRRAGQRHRFTWTVQGAHGIGALGRFDHDRGEWTRPPLGDGVIPGEATLVPYGEAEDAVWVLSHVFDLPSARTGVAVLDGARPEAPPVARIWFAHHVPPSLHGCFVAAA